MNSNYSYTKEWQHNNAGARSSNVLGTAVKGTLYSLGGIIVSKPLGIIIQLLISRIFGAQYFGLFALGLTIIKIAELIGAVGLHQGGMRFMSIAYSKGESKNLSPIAIFSLGFAAVTGLLLAIVMFNLADTIAKNWFGNIELINVLKWMIVAVPFAVLLKVGCFLSRGFQTTKYAVAVENIFLPSTNMIFFLIFYFLNFGFYSVLFSFILSRMLSFFIIVIILFRLLNSKIYIKESNPADNIQYKQILLYSLPFVGAGMLSYVLGSTDMIMLGRFVHVKYVGEYAAASQVAIQMTIFLSATNSIFAPLVAGAFGQNDIGEIRLLYKTITRWLFFLALPLLVFIVFARHEIMHLFGQDFIITGPAVLLILSLGQFVNMITGGVGIILNMTGQQTRNLINTAISAVLNIILNLILIPAYGAVGAAIATAISLSSINLLRVLQVYLLFRVQPFNDTFRLPLIVSGIFLLSFTLFGTNIPTFWAFQNILFAGIISASLVVLLIVYTLSEDDRLLIKKIRAKVLSNR